MVPVFLEDTPCNFNFWSIIAQQIPLTRPRSPKLGRKPSSSMIQELNSQVPRRPSVNAESSKRVVQKGNQSTTRSVTLLPKKKAHENASPNIQRWALTEGVSRKQQHIFGWIDLPSSDCADILLLLHNIEKKNNPSMAVGFRLEGYYWRENGNSRRLLSTSSKNFHSLSMYLHLKRKAVLGR